MDGEIDGPTLRQLLADDETPLIVDVRQPDSFEREHIPGSHNVPFGDLPERIDDVADADRVVTVCPHGKASVKAARLVGSYREFDGEALSLRGGLEAWEGPVATDDGSGADGGAADDEASGDGQDAPF